MFNIFSNNKINKLEERVDWLITQFNKINETIDALNRRGKSDKLRLLNLTDEIHNLKYGKDKPNG